MPSNRHNVSVAVTLGESQIDRLRNDPNMKVMLYCATSSLLTNYDLTDVAFPNQLEVRMNQEEVKSNFKGLKSKPGTTKPADLTSYIRKTAGYPNNLQVTYALTSKVSMCATRKTHRNTILIFVCRSFRLSSTSFTRAPRTSSPSA